MAELKGDEKGRVKSKKIKKREGGEEGREAVLGWGGVGVGWAEVGWGGEGRGGEGQGRESPDDVPLAL